MISAVSFTGNNTQQKNNGMGGTAAATVGTAAAVSKPVSDAAKFAKLQKLSKDTIETTKIVGREAKTASKVLARAKNAFTMFSGKTVKWFNNSKAFGWIKPVIKSPIGKVVGGVVGLGTGIVVLIDGIGQMVRAAVYTKDKLSGAVS